MGLGTIGSIFIMLGGELIGDASFLATIFSGQKEGTTDDKRKLMLMPFFSLIFSTVAATITFGMPRLCRYLGMLAFRKFSVFRPCIKNIFWFIRNICELDIFSQFTYIAVFIFFYSRFKNKLLNKISALGRSIIKDKEEFLGIYVHDSLGTKYVLSEKWEVVYHYICTFICIDIAILAVIHIRWPDTVKNILNVKLVDMLPLVILVFLMEMASYLSAEERQWWKWLMRKRDKQAADCSLNTINLESAMTKYTSANRINVLKRRYSHEYNFPKKTQEYIDEWRNERDATIQYLLDYVEKGTVKRAIPLHSIDSAIRLVKGENLYIANLFYKDLDVSIFFPIFLALLKGEKALIMVEDNGNLNGIADWLRRGIEDIQDLPDFWVVEELRPMVGSVDVGILAFQEICEEEALKWCRDFLSKVSFVVILEASNLLAGGQDLIMSLASRIGGSVERCTWLLTDRNAESMIDLYSHLLDKEFVYVSATPYHSRDAMVIYWDVEGESRDVWPLAKRYLGVEASIAEIAGKENVGKIHWYGEEIMPVRDLYWIWGQYYKSYQQRTGAAVPYQMLIEENIEIEISGNGNDLRMQQFIVTEDECFNLFEKGRQYSTRGLEKTFVCILSPNYMLRDYMKMNYQTFEEDAKYIPQFVVEHVDSRRNIALRILRRLLEEPISHTELKKILAKEDGAGDKIDVSESVLKGKVGLILPDVGDFDFSITHQNCFSEQNRQIEREIFYQIIDEKIKREFQKQFSQAVYIDEAGEVRHISKMILGEHLDQKYEKGQFVVFDGKYFEITGKTTYNNVKALQVKRASDQIRGRKYYRISRRYEVCFPLSKYNMPNTESHRSIMDDQFLEIVGMPVTLKAKNVSYLEMDSWNNIKGARRVDLPGEESEEFDREYAEKQVLGIKLKGRDHKAALLMAAFMKETFCTLYPQFYHLLDVAVDYTVYENDMNEELKGVIAQVDLTYTGEKKIVIGPPTVQAISARHAITDAADFFIVEDSREDMGLLHSIERNISKIMDIMREYMVWSKQSGRNYFKYDGS